MRDTKALADLAIAELASVFDRIDSGAAESIAAATFAAKRIVCHGLGREGLMIRAFCMRLMHLGLDAHMAGDVTTPPIGPGDLFITSSGPGDLRSVRTMLELARSAGARTLVLTAQPGGPDPRAADVVVQIPARTMANDRVSESMLAMGTAYEIAQLILLDLATIRLRELTGQTAEQIRARHYNLE
jgi:6-phospho-3-hexuloisomerase